MSQSREQTESNRQALIRALMDDEGLTYAEASLKESQRFCAAMSEFLKSGKLVRRLAVIQRRRETKP